MRRVHERVGWHRRERGLLKNVDRVESDERRVETGKKGRMVQRGRAAYTGKTAEHPGKERVGEGIRKSYFLRKSVTGRQADRQTDRQTDRDRDRDRDRPTDRADEWIHPHIESVICVKNREKATFMKKA